jgi:hypothetical protein
MKKIDKGKLNPGGYWCRSKHSTYWYPCQLFSDGGWRLAILNYLKVI